MVLIKVLVVSVVSALGWLIALAAAAAHALWAENITVGAYASQLAEATAGLGWFDRLILPAALGAMWLIATALILGWTLWAMLHQRAVIACVAVGGLLIGMKTLELAQKADFAWLWIGCEMAAALLGASVGVACAYLSVRRRVVGIAYVVACLAVWAVVQAAGWRAY